MIRTPYYGFYGWIATVLVCCLFLLDDAVAGRLQAEPHAPVLAQDADATVELAIEGRTFVLDDLFFESDEADLNRSGKQTLQRLIDFLGENPGAVVALSGEMPWSEYQEKRLAHLRAESAGRFLIDRGISVLRIILLVGASRGVPPTGGRGVAAG